MSENTHESDVDFAMGVTALFPLFLWRPFFMISYVVSGLRRSFTLMLTGMSISYRDFLQND